jgi:predicted O-methyltransferase YrrM
MPLALKTLVAGKGRQAIRMALREPARAWKYLRRSYSKRWMKEVFSDTSEYEQFSIELEEFGLLDSMEAQMKEAFSGIKGTTARGQPYAAGALPRRHAYCLYGLIRKLRPEIIVETGVCNGYSTAVILAACTKNGKGHLYSIDYPEFTGARGMQQQFWEGKGGAVVPQDRAPGWLIPESIRDRWTLRLGMSSKVLLPLLEELESIDMFFHDSEHSFENQMFEMMSAWQFLVPSGLLVCSDINWSDAFDSFWTKKRGEGATRRFVDFGLGFIHLGS